MIDLRLYLENIAGDWFGWIEDYPGAFVQGDTVQEVERTAPRAFHEYLAWLSRHGETLPSDLIDAANADFNATVVETVAELADAPWTLRHRLPEDERALRSHELERYLRLLRYSRADLSDVAHAIPPHEWDTAPLGEQSIRAILLNIGHCDTSLLERIGLEPTVRNHQDPWITLLRTRTAFECAVQAAFSRESDPALKRGAAPWSLPRALRLALWNERRAAKRIALRSNASAYLRSVVRGETSGRLFEQPERSDRAVSVMSEATSLARHTHSNGYYY